MTRKNPISDEEISIIKGFLNEGFENQSILDFINHNREKTINIGRISEIKKGKKGKNIQAISKKEVEELIQNYSFKREGNKLQKKIFPTNTENNLITLPINITKETKIEEICKMIDSQNFAEESEFLEYKKELSQENKHKVYKTMVGMANNQGGFIIIGVTNNKQKLDNCKTLDVAEIDKIKNDFTPRIKYQHIPYSGRVILQIAQSKDIIMSIKDREKAYHSNDIYFRYKGETSKIRQEELSKKVINKENLQNYIENILKTSEEEEKNINFIKNIHSRSQNALSEKQKDYLIGLSLKVFKDIYS